MHALLMGCVCMKHAKKPPGDDDPTVLAAETTFTVSEVQALHELFQKLSSSITDDGLLNKEEFQLALFRNSKTRNIFADRVFALFDLKHNGAIDFEEFVRSLSVFHPNAPESEKITFAFRLYDLRDAGYIERSEVKEMVLALLSESDLSLSDDVVEAIVEKTFSEADSKGDGRIDLDEWKEFVEQNPKLLKNMTLPYLSFHPQVVDTRTAPTWSYGIAYDAPVYRTVARESSSSDSPFKTELVYQIAQTFLTGLHFECHSSEKSPSHFPALCSSPKLKILK